MTYDKITDIVMRLGLNAVLKFNVSLSSQGKDNSRKFCYCEYSYNSRKYNTELVSIKREADYYLSIENIIKPYDVDKAFIRIDNVGIVKLKSALEVAYNWFTGVEYNHLFIKSHGRLILDGSHPEFIIPDLPMGKYLKFVPCVVERGTTSSDLYPGIYIELGDRSNIVDMDVNTLFAFKNVIDTFNMYLAYSMMMNFVFGKSTEPINRFNISSNGFTRYEPQDVQTPIKQPHASSFVAGRTIGGKKKSISDLE